MKKYAKLDLSATQTLKGVGIAHAHLSHAKRIKLAMAMTAGNISVSHLTVAQAAAIAGVKVTELQTNLNAKKRAAAQTSAVKAPSERQLRRTISAAGVEPSWEALVAELEKMSAPAKANGKLTAPVIEDAAR